MAAFAGPGAQPYVVASAPAWASVAPDPTASDATPAVEAGDSDYLLVDHQVRLGESTERYTRYVELLVNQASVDASAQISLDIDPEHELVQLHAVRVFRAGHRIDKLLDARRSLLNREEGLERGLIDGRVTLHLLLQDIRVGDVLDYSYTIVRKDEIRERGYYDWFQTQWGVPVRHYRLRVLHPPQRKLFVRDQGALGEPARRQAGPLQEIAWERRNVPGLPNETARPGWHFLYPRIELSEFASWAAVRDWALPLYQVQSPKDSSLDRLVAELAAEADPETQVLRALRFVQDDIRYTGLEIGAGAWRPSQPGVVFARRYGDCKDKVLLLVALLRRLGFTAQPALVNSYTGRGVEHRLPSPGAFNHVIARVRLEDRTYWLDATSSGQGGRLDTLVQADFGRALVIAADRSGLEVIPRGKLNQPSSHVVETFDFGKDTRHTAALAVKTIYRDGDADSMRGSMRTKTVAQLSEDYLNYYRKSHAGTRVGKPLRVSDDREANRITLEEFYEIDTPFSVDAAGQREFALQAYLITEQTGKPDQTVRISPLARTFPLHVRHEIVVQLPGKWTIKDETQRVVDDAFEYHSKVTFRGGKLQLAYELRNTRDHVGVTRLGEFLTRLEKARADTFFTLTDGASSAAATDADDHASIEMIAIALIGLGIGVLLASQFWKIPWRLPAAEPGAPQGLGGWLVLPMLGMLVYPAMLIYQINSWFQDVGSATVFQGLARDVQYWLLLEFTLGYIMLVLSLFGVWLMFQRRQEFPLLFIATQILSVAMLAADYATLVSLGEAGEEERPLLVAGFIRDLISGVIWACYMLRSQRVRATFVRRHEPRGAAAVPSDAPAPLA
jgi:transglutaminase-like putative cysteine protease